MTAQLMKHRGYEPAGRLRIRSDLFSTGMVFRRAARLAPDPLNAWLDERVHTDSELDPAKIAQLADECELLIFKKGPLEMQRLELGAKLREKVAQSNPQPDPKRLPLSTSSADSCMNAQSHDARSDITRGKPTPARAGEPERWPIYRACVQPSAALRLPGNHGVRFADSAGLVAGIFQAFVGDFRPKPR
jgi:hypothetical protein